MISATAVHPEIIAGSAACAEHQPQRAASTRAVEIFPDLDTSQLLRLVCDTAALRTDLLAGAASESALAQGVTMQLADRRRLGGSRRGRLVRRFTGNRF